MMSNMCLKLLSFAVCLIQLSDESVFRLLSTLLLIILTVIMFLFCGCCFLACKINCIYQWCMCCCICWRLLLSVSCPQEEVLLEVLGLANQYGFVELQTAMSEYLKAVLHIRNVCLIFDIASIYGLHSLCETCCRFMDHNAAEILRSDGFLSLSPVRDTFDLNSLWSVLWFRKFPLNHSPYCHWFWCHEGRYLIRYSAFFCVSAMPAQHTWSTGLLCGRHIALELSSRQLERSVSWHGQLQTSDAEDALYWSI